MPTKNIFQYAQYPVDYWNIVYLNQKSKISEINFFTRRIAFPPVFTFIQSNMLLKVWKCIDISISVQGSWWNTEVQSLILTIPLSDHFATLRARAPASDWKTNDLHWKKKGRQRRREAITTSPLWFFAIIPPVLMSLIHVKSTKRTYYRKSTHTPIMKHLWTGLKRHMWKR